MVLKEFINKNLSALKKIYLSNVKNVKGSTNKDS